MAKKTQNQTQNYDSPEILEAGEIVIPESPDPDNLLAIELASMFDSPEMGDWLDVAAPERIALKEPGDILRGTFLGFFEMPWTQAVVDRATGEVTQKRVVLRIGRFADADFVSPETDSSQHFPMVDCYITASLLRSSLDVVPLGTRVVMQRTSKTRKIGQGTAVVYNVLAARSPDASMFQKIIGKNPLDTPKQLTP